MRSMLFLLLLITTFPGYAQTPLEQAFAELKIGTELPEDLLATRSAVFLKSSSPDSTRIAHDWELLVEELHKNLVALHIDAVAYYRWQDLIAGFDASGSYIRWLKDREINQVILLSIDKENFQIYIIPTSDQPGLLATDSPSWHTRSNSLESAIKTLAITVRRTGLDIANFLIAESPEFFIDTEIFKKNRFESFQPDLKLDKLAAPLFFGNDPDNLENSADKELESIMRQAYPFKYELVSTKLTEDLMKKAGFQYVLRYLHAEESTLKTLLDYTDQETSSSTVGYKYYIKHLITGDIYLGDTWDSRIRWQAALSVHLKNLKRSLKVE